MTDEIDLIHDGEGLAIFGEPTTVERFLESHDFCRTRKVFVGKVLSLCWKPGQWLRKHWRRSLPVSVDM